MDVYEFTYETSTGDYTCRVYGASRDDAEATLRRVNVAPVRVTGCDRIRSSLARYPENAEVCRRADGLPYWIGSSDAHESDQAGTVFYVHLEADGRVVAKRNGVDVPGGVHLPPQSAEEEVRVLRAVVRTLIAAAAPAMDEGADDDVEAA